MRTALVITSIHAPNPALAALTQGCAAKGWDFIIAGDAKSPADFHLDGCRFLTLDAQRASGFRLGTLAPIGSYTRKNLGYLEAMRAGAEVIVETDDDNHPLAAFWNDRTRQVSCRPVTGERWVNACSYFASSFIYPRGMPLPVAREPVPQAAPPEVRDCPVQQGLADGDPDVDAVYRMLFPLPFHFDIDEGPVLLEPGTWCPFNSQNTTFFREAFPLLYLPANCSFRMTDIWRSFVAQRVLAALSSGVLFHAPTVVQHRNDHDLHRDFLDEIPGYSHNEAIRRTLGALDLRPEDPVTNMMGTCYEALMREGWISSGEETLLQAWFDDLAALGITGTTP